MATVTPTLPCIEYPESDGEPMGETPIHRRQMADVLEMLDDYYVDVPDAYISGNMMMYYVEGNPKKSISPDVFVTLGIPKLPERRVYLTWLEGKGPDFVVEMHSRGTWRTDVGWKLDLYRDVLKVREYFLFDPLEERPGAKPLVGFRLVDGAYQPIPEVDGRLFSEVLGLYLEADGERLRLFDPRRGAYLLSPREVREALAREALARAAAEAQRAAEARARAAAEARAQHDADARAAAEAQRAAEARARAAAETRAQHDADARAAAEAQRAAEARARAAAETRAQHDADARAAAEAQRAAEARARAAAETRAQHDADARAAAEAQRAAEARARAAAETRAQHDADARAAAEAEVARLRREIEELRRSGPTGH